VVSWVNCIVCQCERAQRGKVQQELVADQHAVLNFTHHWHLSNDYR
jgi:hypothetical protein